MFSEEIYSQPRFDYTGKLNILTSELREIKNALSAVEVAVAGLDCNDTAAQEGIASWIVALTSKLGAMIRDLEPEKTQEDESAA